ncbi:hypothetical protein [Bacillus sp. SJS]|uniref:hypothetical protein n=1 Tax=Bacillus sp. SJS TaxID=1423321 RepID=UPI0004DD1AD7|nr:hypothetical protein [Bacillus sp. SJS]KZZ83071.1 hypothetical protein AS29_019995 [Bacillus sp. SJS]
MPEFYANEIHFTIIQDHYIPQQLHPYQLQALKHDYRAMLEENKHDPIKLEAAQKAFKRVLNSIGYHMEIKNSPSAQM